MYHICGYHDICPKSADIWSQYQKDQSKYFKSKGDLSIDVRGAILPVY